MIFKSRLIPLLLFILIAFGVGLRLYRFGSIPLSLNRDEAALGYNAFAVGHFGQDEWGVSYPLIFQSFGDAKLPGYIYTLIPFISFLGIREWVIRLPSLVAGLTLMLGVYQLARELKFNQLTSIFAASLIAISPWAIFYSRVAFEANLSLALLIFSLVFLLKKTSLKSILIGTAFFAFSVATYNTPLLLTPLVILLVWLSKAASIKQKTVKTVLLLVIAALWLLILIPLLRQKSGITVFTDPTIIVKQQEGYAAADSLIERLRFNRYLDLSLIMGSSWIKSFHPQFLAIGGGANPWHSAPHTGHLPWTLVILAFIGVFRAIKAPTRSKLIPISLALIGVLPAVVTIDAPHATRSLLAFVGLTLLVAQTWPKRSWMQFLIISALFIEVIVYSQRYFINFPQNHSDTWQVGLKQTLLSGKNRYPDQTIVVTNPKAQPYIYALLYFQVPPERYQNTVEYYGVDSAGIESVQSFDNWLFIGHPDDAPPNTPIIHQDQSGQFQIAPDKTSIER